MTALSLRCRPFIRVPRAAAWFGLVWGLRDEALLAPGVLECCNVEGGLVGLPADGERERCWGNGFVFLKLCRRVFLRAATLGVAPSPPDLERSLSKLLLLENEGQRRLGDCPELKLRACGERDGERDGER